MRRAVSRIASFGLRPHPDLRFGGNPEGLAELTKIGSDLMPDLEAVAAGRRP